MTKFVELNSTIQINDDSIGLIDSQGSYTEFKNDEMYMIANWLNVYFKGYPGE